MEETKPRPGFPGDRAHVAAEKLRALRQRANQALDDHRERLAQIESELSLRVRQLAEEFETASTGLQRHADHGRDEEIAALREQLDEGRAKHDKFVEQLVAARRQLDAIQALPCAACQDAAHQLADAQSEMNRLREQVQAADHQREEDRARHDKFAEQVAAARQAITDLQNKSYEQTAALQSELESACAAKVSAEEQVAGLARDMEVLHAEYDDLNDRAEQLELERTSSLDEQRRAADAEIAQQLTQLGELQDELETVRRAHASLEHRAESLQSRLADSENERDVLARQKDEAEVAKSSADSELAALKSKALTDQQTAAQRTAEGEAKIAELLQRLSDAETETATLAAALSDANAENAKLAAGFTEAASDLRRAENALDAAQRQIETLEEAGGELAALRESTCPRAERDDVQQKFDLALADVQKLKRENGDLRQELASRPESSQTESPELVAVRTERDALVHRVEELQRAAATAGASDATAAQEMDDQRRRFEMAVDDVRQLKQENAALRDQAAKAKSGGPAVAAPAGGANDWAAQRARLVAMLEDEEGDGPIDAARRKERASIEEAIERTDRAMAEKNRELAELRTAHESQTAATASDRLQGDREEMLDADELVAAERKRLAALQTEWEQKLRSAELEFSVERAKLAREQSALKERLFDLQKVQAQSGPAAEPVDHKQPRRRWLSALGLGEEGDEPAKPK